MADRLEGPIVAIFFRDGEVAASRQAWRLRLLFRPRGAHLHPFDERLDLAGLEFAGGRHLEPAIVDGVDHRAGVGIARNDGGPRVAPFEQPTPANRAAIHPYDSPRRDTFGRCPPAPDGPSPRKTRPDWARTAGRLPTAAAGPARGGGDHQAAKRKAASG